MKRLLTQEALFVFWFKISRKSRLMNYFFKHKYSCEIPGEVKMGENIHFGHNALGVIIHPFTKIGNNVCIQHHVLLGEKNGVDAPTIHDNVVINPYSIVIGKVTIGENSVIGAGSIVTKDVPDNSVYYNQISPVIKKITPEERQRLIR